MEIIHVNLLATNVASGCNFINYVSKYCSNQTIQQKKGVIVMKSNLFAKFFNMFLFVLVSFAMSASLVGPAAAQKEISAVATQQPDVPCEFGPLNAVGPAPLTVHFDASASQASGGYSWFTPDENHADGGETFDHTFKNPGDYKVRVTCYNSNGTFSWVTTWVTVKAPASQSVSVVTPTPNPSGNTSPNGNGSTAKGSIEGDNNFAPVVNGDNNEINITIEQTPVPAIPTPTVSATPVTPIVPDNSCYGNCASNGGTIIINPPPVQNSPVIKTSAVSGWWTLVRMIISPFIIMDEWIVQNK